MRPDLIRSPTLSKVYFRRWLVVNILSFRHSKSKTLTNTWREKRCRSLSTIKKKPYSINCFLLCHMVVRNILLSINKSPRDNCILFAESETILPFISSELYVVIQCHFPFRMLLPRKYTTGIFLPRVLMCVALHGKVQSLPKESVVYEAMAKAVVLQNHSTRESIDDLSVWQCNHVRILKPAYNYHHKLYVDKRTQKTSWKWGRLKLDKYITMWL